MKTNLKRIMVYAVPVVLGIAALSGCNLGGGNTSSSTSTGSEESKVSYVSLNINPEIELFVDGDEVVVNVYGVNEDAQVLLYEEEDNIEGKTLDEAIDKIISLSVDMGFLSEENHTIATQVSTDDVDLKAKIQTDIDAQISVSTKNLGFEVETTLDQAFSTLREFEAFKAEHPESDVIQALTIEEFKLALRASEEGDISLEAAVLLDDSELIDIINTATDEVAQFTTKTFEKIRALAEQIYVNAEVAVVNLEYAKFYASRMLTDPMTAYYGSMYQIYNLSSVTMDALVKAIEAVQNLESYELDEDKINEIIAASGIEGLTKEDLQDLSGRVTIESVEEYLNKVYKNVEELETSKEEMMNKMQEIANEIKAEVNALSEEHKEDIEDILKRVETTISTAKLSIPPQYVSAFEEKIAAYEEIAAEIKTKIESDELTLDDLKEFSDELKAKAEECEKDIQDDLTDEEEATLNANIEKAKEGLASIKAQYEQTLNAAEVEAKTHLGNLKDALLNKKDETVTE